MKMNKRYEYCGLIYCEDDLSKEIDNYGGDLYELFVALECDDRAERKVMYCSIDGFDGESGEYIYGDCRYLIESEFSELEVEENENDR